MTEATPLASEQITQPITMTGYMGAIGAGAPFIMDYGQKDVEELVRVSDVQPADDVCCKVRLEGTTFWMPEIEFRRRATPFIPGTPSAALSASPASEQSAVATGTVVDAVNRLVSAAKAMIEVAPHWRCSGVALSDAAVIEQLDAAVQDLAATPTPPAGDA